MTNIRTGAGRRCSVPMRVLCLLLSVLLIMPAGGAAAGFVAPVQAASSTIVNTVSGGFASAAHALSAFGKILSGKMGSFGGSFGRFVPLLNIVPLGLGDPDEEELHQLDAVYWNRDPNDREDHDAGIYLTGGNDDNSGEDASHPVLTWEKAVSLVAPGGVIYVLSQDVLTAETEEDNPIVYDGGVENTATALDYYQNLSTFFHVTEGTSFTVKNLEMVMTAAQAADHRLMLLDGGDLTLGENMTFKGIVELEQLLPEGEAMVKVDPSLVQNFAANMQLTFKFQINMDLTNEDTACTAAWDGRTYIDLVEFPAGFDASALIDLNDASNGAISLVSELCDSSTLPYVWKMRLKNNNPNVVQAYLADKYDGAIYISGGSTASDSNDGLYPYQPVKTFDRAIAILTGTAPDSVDINRYREQHGGYQVNQGVIRVVEAVPVGTDDSNAPEVWTMPANTWWTDAGGNQVSPTWVERYEGNLFYGMISVASGKYFSMHDITVKGNKALVPNAHKSVLTVAGDATLGANALITENHADTGGGATVFRGTLHLNGGKITQCDAVSTGGGIYSFYGTVDMQSGEISGNTAVNGGGIYSRTAVLNISGGEIKSNTATDGGGVYLFRVDSDITEPPVSPVVTFSGGAIKNNTASGNGGGLYLTRDPALEAGAAATALTLTANGEGEGVLNNTAACGGGIYTNNDFTVRAADATSAVIAATPGWVCTAAVTNNLATSSGGGWYVNGSGLADGVSFVLDGGAIAGNRSSASGAGISLVNAEFTMRNAATVHGNIATVGNDTRCGAGVCMTSARAFRMDGSSKIYQNKIQPAGNQVYGTLCGGGVYVSGSAASAEPSDDFKIAGEIYGNQLIGKGFSSDGWHTAYYSHHLKGCGAYFVGVPLKVDGGKIYNNSGENYYGQAYGTGLYHGNGKLLITNDAQIYGNSRVNVMSYSYVDGSHYGGGVYKSGGTLTIENSKIYNNTITFRSYMSYGSFQGGGVCVKDDTSVTVTGGAIFNNDAGFRQGGGLYIENVPAVTLQNARFQGNRADNAGGGLYLYKVANSQMTGCAFENNTATNDGGGLFINNSDLTQAQTHTATGATFTGNRANRGGAAFFGGRKVDSNYNYNYIINMSACTFTGNVAAAKDAETPGLGGALYNQYAAVTLGGGNTFTTNTADRGGALYNEVGSCTLKAEEGETATAMHNNAAPLGAGIYVKGGNVFLRQCDLTGNDDASADPVRRGPSAYSEAGFIHLNAADVALDTIYLYSRSYPLRLIGAPSSDFACNLDLNIGEGSDYFRSADTVVTPYGDVTDAAPYEENFLLIREAAAAYNLIPSGVNLVLAPRAVYIDGVDGDDANNGSKPTTAVRTFARARALMIDLLNGAPDVERTIWVVNTVTVDDTQVWSFAGETMPRLETDPETGETVINGTTPITGVRLLAYCPENTPFKSLYTSMVLVNGAGDLTIEGIEVNANRSAFSARCPQFGVRLIGTAEQPVAFTFKNNSAIEGDVALMQNCYAALHAQYGSVTLDHAKFYNNNCNTARSNDSMRNNYGAGVTVRDGTLTANDVTLQNCTGYQYGAGMYLLRTTAQITGLYAQSCVLNDGFSYSGNYSSGHTIVTAVNGGCIYSYDSDLTVSDSTFTKNVSKIAGACIGVVNGTITCTDTTFSENGILETQYVNINYKGNAGVVHLRGSVAANFTGVTFNQNKGAIGAGIRMERLNSTVPTLTVKGGAFTSNYSYNGGGAIYAIGDGASNMPTVTILPDDRTETPVRTVFSGNGAYQYFGALAAVDANLSVTDADFTGNYTEYLSAVSNMNYCGGAAITQRRGTFTMTGCTVTGNRTSRGSVSNSSYNLYGAVVSAMAPSVRIENCNISNNTINGGGTFTLVGAGLSVIGSCPDFILRGCTVTGNVINETNTGSGVVAGAGMFVSGGSSLLENNDFSNNRLATSANEGSKQLRGAAIFFSGGDVQIKNLTTLGCTANTRDIIRFNSAARIRMEGEIVMDGDTQNIVLLGNTTPIELTGPLNAFEGGRLALSYDETFIGKPIVKGYTVDYATPELDAEIYLPADANPRFISGPEPTAQQLVLVPGEDDYDHDIVVEGNHVYLATSGVDDEAHGNSPLTPVKTFAYAKQRLATRMAGANIIIVSNGVTVSETESWSLEEMTDASGATWQPIVQRYMNPNNERSGRYTGVLVTVAAGGELTLTNIKIDGRYSATKVRVLANSILRSNGGTLRIGSGAHLTNNIADYGALVYVGSGSEAYISDGALLNYGYGAVSLGTSSSGVDAWGCGVYINGGSLEMTGGEISSCGPQYYGSCGGYTKIYGALVCLETNGVFRQLGGVLRDARIYGDYSYAWTGETSRKFSEVHGAVYVGGSRYNAETGTGVFFECRGTIRDNFWVQNYATQNGNNCVLNVYGSAIQMNNGTAEIGEGALITRNYSMSSTFTSSIPINIENSGLVTFKDGAVMKEHQPNVMNSSTGYVHSYNIFVRNGGNLVMNGGDISDIDASYLVYLYGSGASFVMNGGELHPSASCAGANTNAVYLSQGVVTLNGGKIWSPAGKGNNGVYAAGSNVTVTINETEEKRGEITGGFKAGVWLSGYQSVFRMNGGRIHDINNGDGVGVRGDNGSSKTMTFNGGEIDHCKRGVGLWQANTTATFNKCKIHHNTVYGIGLPGGSTVNITSDDVEVYNNASSNDGQGRGIWANNGTLKMTAGKVYDNDITASSGNGGGGIFIGQTVNCNISNAKIYNNDRRGSGGGIEFTSGNNRTSTVSNSEIRGNSATGTGGGIYLWEDYSGNVTNNYNLTGLDIDSNRAGGWGGGLFFDMAAPDNTSYQYTANVSFDNLKVHGNTAGASAGGIGLSAGRSTTRANMKALKVNATLRDVEIYENSAGGNGGGLLVRVQQRVNTQMETQLAGKLMRIENNRAGGNGGGVYAFSVNHTARDNTVYLPGLYITGNEAGVDFNTEDENPPAWADGGGIAAQNAYLVMNNTKVNNNRTNRFGGGIAALDGSEFMIQMGELKNNVADGGEFATATSGRGNGVYVGLAMVQLVNNLLETGENDDFYITRFAAPLLMYKTFTNVDRVYKLYPGEEDFEVGDIVVHPNGICPDASTKLNNFISIRPGTVLERRYPDIIIGKILFLDGVDGHDPTFNGDEIIYYQDPDTGVIYDGTSPEKALYTFGACKRVLNGYPGSIYVCGTVTVSDTQEWSLVEGEYLRRYCGFKVPGDNTVYEPFLDDMFVVAENGDLTVENITIQGCYNEISTYHGATGSVFVVGETPEEPDPSATPPANPPKPAKLTVKDGASITDNITSADGGAIRIEAGAAHITGGTIANNPTTGKGSAVYQGDTLTLQGNTLKIGGDVYLAKGNAQNQIPDRVITVLPVPGATADDPPAVPALDFAPAGGTKIEVSVENPYDGRDIVSYPEEEEDPGAVQKALYQLAPAIASLYVVANDRQFPNILELRLPYAIYLDGVNGDDDNDGLTADTAVLTLKHAYELISQKYTDTEGGIPGGLVYVVDTVTVDQNTDLSTKYISGGTTVDAKVSKVLFKRYAQPTAHATLTGFTHPTNLAPLFTVADTAVLTTNGVDLDGHALAVPAGADETTVAPGVTAHAPLINLIDSGRYELLAGTLANNKADTSTGGAITVHAGTAAAVKGGVISNTLDSKNVSIYQKGTLEFSGSPDIGGTVYLEKPEYHVDVPAAYTPVHPVEINVHPESIFNGRDIAIYAATLNVPGDTEKAYWKLPDAILANYNLNNNPDDARILELQRKGCVYIDGVSGNDALDGATPDTAVKTLKRAYEILHAIGGVTVYVVNEVRITDPIMLDGQVFSDGNLIQAAGPVQFVRYAQPSGYDPAETDHGELEGYSKPSCISPLFTVADGGTLYAAGITIDGHSNAVTEEQSPGAPQFVAPGVIAAGALIKVEQGGELELQGGITLKCNNNTLPAPTGEGKGGAVENSGTLTVGKCLITENAAKYGAGVYQNGDMTLKGDALPVFGANQEIYLTGLKDSAQEHVIEVDSQLAEDFTVTVNFEWPEGGRNAVHFASGAFTGSVANEIEHFPLAPSVSYILVQSPEETEPNMLELCETYTLRYNGNGGTLPDGVTVEVDDPGMPLDPELGIKTYRKGDIITVRSNEFPFQQAGKTFVAWNSKPDGTGKTFLPGDKYWSDTVGIFQSAVLYAVWADGDAQYTVTYKPNNGVATDVDYVDGPYAQLATVTVRDNTGPTAYTVPEGKRFIGWNTQPDESGDWYFSPGADLPGFIPTVTNDAGQFLIAGNIVLYAIYRTAAPYSLTIFKYADMRDMKEPNKTFLFEIEDIYPLSGNYGKKYYVYLGTYTDAATGATMPAWIENTYCYTTVTGLPEGKYRVRELTEWSWRYTLTDAYGADTVNYAVSAEKEIVVALNDHRTVSFVNELTNPYYVNGYARSYSNTFIQS